MELLLEFDTYLFLKIHKGLSNDFFDWLMPLLRNRFFWAPLYIFMIVFCLKVYKRKGLNIIGGLLLTFAMGDLLASRVIKPLVGRIRPCNDLSLVDEIIKRVPCGSGYSFPSAHATNHFALALFTILVFYRVWKPVLPIGILWAFSISFSQIYVGVHYPLDILAGTILGLLIGFSVFRIFKNYNPVT